MNNYNLAQINVAKALADMDSPVMEGFVARLDEINALADQAPGFVWRLQTEEGDATSLQVFDDPRMLVNMSVWATVEDLKHYVYKSVHVELIRDREAWFSKMSDAHQALWWVPAGHTPTVEEGKEKLESIRHNGPTESAFTMARPFPVPAS